jgi:hypothetical protein
MAIAWQIDEFRSEDKEFRWSGNKKETDDPVETIIERWQEKVGLKIDPAAQALEAMKAFYKATGRPWDDTPVTADWREVDTEIPGNYMGGQRGKRGEGVK